MKTTLLLLLISITAFAQIPAKNQISDDYYELTFMPGKLLLDDGCLPAMRTDSTYFRDHKAFTVPIAYKVEVDDNWYPVAITAGIFIPDRVQLSDLRNGERFVNGDFEYEYVGHHPIRGYMAVVVRKGRYMENIYFLNNIFVIVVR